MKLEKIKLNYDYDALEPYIDKQTMKLHYEKHHESYLNNLKKEITKLDLKKYESLENMMATYLNIDDPEIRVAVRQFGGGLLNHNIFFERLKKDVEFKDGNLKNAILKEWGSIEKFKEDFKAKSLSLFGSGWVWLVVQRGGKLKNVKTFNQDTPIFLKLKPIIGIDLWEHSYYLKYNGDRSTYIDNFFKCIDWDKCEEVFNE